MTDAPSLDATLGVAAKNRLLWAAILASFVSFLTSHIYPPRGVITMLVLAAGWSILVAVRPQRRAG